MVTRRGLFVASISSALMLVSSAFSNGATITEYATIAGSAIDSSADGGNTAPVIGSSNAGLQTGILAIGDDGAGLSESAVWAQFVIDPLPGHQIVGATLTVGDFNGSVFGSIIPGIDAAVALSDPASAAQFNNGLAVTSPMTMLPLSDNSFTASGRAAISTSVSDWFVGGTAVVGEGLGNILTIRLSRLGFPDAGQGSLQDGLGISMAGPLDLLNQPTNPMIRLVLETAPVHAPEPSSFILSVFAIVTVARIRRFQRR